jgi:crotonobetainyl-CoA:carnitine CoA-transferase CaiB-like acyl-CoA transferase
MAAITDRPLDLKGLDLTAVLSGPVAMRFLAGCGANVLRINPSGWDEAGSSPKSRLANDGHGSTFISPHVRASAGATRRAGP